MWRLNPNGTMVKNYSGLCVIAESVKDGISPGGICFWIAKGRRVFDDENQAQENSFIYVIAEYLQKVDPKSDGAKWDWVAIYDECAAVLYQRDTIQAVTSFAKRNKLPVLMQEQMIAHLHMKYRTDIEGLQQQEFKYIFIFRLNTLLDINIV
ncbi:hypothetical protein HN873_049220 [Arachis hypogaea]